MLSPRSSWNQWTWGRSWQSLTSRLLINDLSLQKSSRQLPLQYHQSSILLRPLQKNRANHHSKYHMIVLCSLLKHKVHEDFSYSIFMEPRHSARHGRQHGEKRDDVPSKWSLHFWEETHKRFFDLFNIREWWGLKRRKLDLQTEDRTVLFLQSGQGRHHHV